MAKSIINKEALGKRIKQLRTSFGFTQQVLAEKAGISVKYLSNVERGNCTCSLGVFLNIANSLNISSDSIFAKQLNYNELNNDSKNEDDMMLMVKLLTLSDKQKNYILHSIELIKEYDDNN